MARAGARTGHGRAAEMKGMRVEDTGFGTSRRVALDRTPHARQNTPTVTRNSRADSGGGEGSGAEFAEQ